MVQAPEIVIHAVFEGRNGGDRDSVRVDNLTERQLGYVKWYQRRHLGRRLVAYVGESKE